MRPLEAIAGDIAAKTAELLALMAELKQAHPRSFTACGNCGQPFEVGTGAASKRRVYCSDRCRVAGNRHASK